ncbi:hypothetical protein POTOM_045766 [Populus tomentosa]|uniref:Plant heme peroxidase family profile domain-containing protein n=1 Tax=Populus tomentosa TaxID=118781 RepID=A0A8X7YKF1_POPTO|nr:hypothetical protein POTOM_045766 [Populus tomentosa]
MDMITEELDDSCPGLVLCADTLALATRYGVFWYVLLLLFLCMAKHSTADLLAGAPFPDFTGRRDGAQA